MAEDDTTIIQKAGKHKGRALATGGGLSLAAAIYLFATKEGLNAERDARCESHRFVQQQLGEINTELAEIRKDIKRIMMRTHDIGEASTNYPLTSSE